MVKCKNCVHCRIGDEYTICEVLRTHCRNTDDPDLGTKFSTCNYEKVKEAEACQKAANSTNGSERMKASRAKSAEND